MQISRVLIVIESEVRFEEDISHELSPALRQQLSWHSEIA